MSKLEYCHGGFTSADKSKRRRNAIMNINRDAVYCDTDSLYCLKKTDDYIQGWHDAITMALKETHSVYTEDGHFRVVQEETLIGLGMAYEHPEKEVQDK